MSNSIISHVNCWIRKRFNKPRFIPWQSSSQAICSRTCMFLEPIQSPFKIISDIIWIAFHILETLFGFGSPFGFTIIQIPLVTDGYDAFISSPRDNLLFRFTIRTSFVCLDHLHFYLIFAFLNLSTCKSTNLEDTFVETFQINLFFRFLKFDGIILRFNFEILASSYSRQVSETGNINNWNWSIWKDHFITDIVLFSQCILILKVNKGCIIVWCIGWHRSNDTCTLAFLDGHHWKSINVVIWGHWCLQFCPHKVNTRKFTDWFNFLFSFEHFLEWHISCRTLRWHIDFSVLCFDSNVGDIRRYPTICLTVHGLGSECSCDEIDIFTFQLWKFCWFSQLNQFHFDKSIFLWSDTFSGSTIVIHTRLVCLGTENTRSFTKGNFLFVFQMVELPSYKGVVIQISVSGNESPSPINFETHFSQIRHSHWWKILKPSVIISEFSNFIVLKSKGIHNLPLVFCRTLFCRGFWFFTLRLVFDFYFFWTIIFFLLFK